MSRVLKLPLKTAISITVDRPAMPASRGASATGLSARSIRKPGKSV